MENLSTDSDPLNPLWQQQHSLFQQFRHNYDTRMQAVGLQLQAVVQLFEDYVGSMSQLFAQLHEHYGQWKALGLVELQLQTMEVFGALR